MSDQREVDLYARLLLCNQEWGAGVVVDVDTMTTVNVTAYELIPVSLKTADYPVIYAMPPSYAESDISAHAVEGVYTINLYLLIAPLTNRKHDDDGIIQAIRWGIHLQMAARVYYDRHRQLSTDGDIDPDETLELSFITDDILLAFTTVGEVATPFGAHIGFNLRLTVPTI